MSFRIVGWGGREYLGLNLGDLGLKIKVRLVWVFFGKGVNVNV